MKKQFSLRSLTLSLIAISLLAIIVIITTTSSKASSPLGTRLSGKILLQVEDSGKAWYVSADNDNQRIYLGSPQEAHCLMKTLGLGISNNDLNRYLNTNDNNFPTRLSGKILLAVEQNGEAYYINPDNLKGYYLGRPIDALKIMRELSLGITNTNLNTIPVLDNTEMLKKCNITKTEEQQENTETNISLVTNPVAPMTNFSHIVSISATLTNPDNISIKERGLLYDFTIFPNTNLTPTLDKYNQKLISSISSNNNTYTINISNLTPGSYPFIRSYAITGDNQIIYGNTINISSTNNAYLPYIPNSSSATNSTAPLEEIPVWTECGDIYYDNRDGNTYNTVVIGNQCWFQENLEETKYIDGSSIPNLITNEQMMEATTGGYCWYKNDPDIYGAYGALYNWNTVVDSKGLCPSGWHIPSKQEFEELADSLGENPGYKLKASSWEDGSDNSSGFTALPSGIRGGNDEDFDENYFGYFDLAVGFWTISEYSSENSYLGVLMKENGSLGLMELNKVAFASTRCILNNNKTITYSAGEGGSVSGDLVQAVSYGSSGTEVEAIPAGGYEFVKWSDGLTTNPRTDSSIIDNIEISAIFAVPCSSEIVCGQSCLYEGEIYNTVTINDQCWFKENLKYLPEVHDNNTFVNLGNSGSPAYGVYGYEGNDVDEAKLTIERYEYDLVHYKEYLNSYSNFGVFYNQHAVTEETICPAGWHIPDDNEWIKLSNFLGDDSLVGEKLKASSTDSIPWNGTNSSGFTALPVGFRTLDGYFSDFQNIAHFWSSSNNIAYTLENWNSNINRIDDANQVLGYSVRCLKNQAYTVTYTAGIGGVLIGSTTQTIAYSEDGTAVTAVPDSGYEFVKWSDGLTTNPRVDSNIIDNIEISAIFAVPCSSEIVCGQSCSYEGEIYNTVTIDDQCWFQDNLNIGIQIDGTNEQIDNTIIEKYCYNNKSVNCDIYGGLYQWNELMNYSTSTTQGICPTGWHVPTDAEWTTLTDYLGTNAGSKLAGSYELWNDGALRQSVYFGASEFNALPAGGRDVNGDFYDLGGRALFWSSSEGDPGYSWVRYLGSGDSEVSRFNLNQSNGCSVRCLRTE